ncbi:hypothetical protein BDW02DRAFT_610144, partial [Decorospora gaudefroyi]
EAISEQRDNGWFGGYSQITFCNRFFNNVKSLDEATKFAKRTDERKENLENWNNRARCFFHEITHLAYFMNTPSLSPYVEDLLINYGAKSNRVEEVAYGPYNVKVLRNYRGDAWYTGQNADTYAWYAMAMYAQKEIGHYPTKPEAKSMKPNKAPRRADGTPLNNVPSANDQDDLEGQEIDYEPAEDFTHPGCGDKMSIAGTDLPVLKVNCIDDASAIASTVFSSDNNCIYDTFCRGATNNRNSLHWMANVFGNLTGVEPGGNWRIRRRSDRFLGKRDVGPEQLTNWQFKLDWTPVTDPFDSSECYLDCPTAFEVLAQTPQCSQRGDGKGMMSISGQIDVGCGTFGYTVTGIAIS